MTAHEQRAAAEKFAQQWLGKGNEKSDTQQFWTSLLRDVFGVEKPEETVEFERPVQLGHVSFIDVYIPITKVLIEQKKLEVDLLKPIKQSDGTSLTPYEQAKRYSDNMSYSERPRWIITCNFQSFNIHDMNRPHDAPTNVALANLGKEYHRLQLLVDPNHGGPGGETEVSVKAGELVGVLYDLLVKEYKDPTNPLSLRSLNILCVRLVFCLYAEDAGIFGKRDMFHDYMAQFNAASFRTALIELFKILNTPLEKRDPYLRPDLAEFPYVNGGLFADEDIEIPNFTEEIRKVTLNKASKDFDWSRISPTIFGAVFESTLNPETRKSGGMHYTSIENIHKVVDPLFLDELRQELSVIQGITAYKDQRKAAQKFQQKLATLKFLDPACGSGNFLTETYLSIRRLENDAIYIINREQGVFGEVDNPIKVSIDQFYGIEINDFAVSVARTALWIAESQMKEETNRLAHTDADFLPLKTNAHIVEDNALTLDWNELCPKEELSYIMGNPPFVGYTNQSEAQRLETRTIFSDENGKEYKNAGKIDYVANWYFKACQYMQGTSICAAFVSTNGITQGELVAFIWKPLYERFGVDILFAYRSFVWDSEASIKAHVHCVIIGFTTDKEIVRAYSKRLFYLKSSQVVENVNPYLVDAPNVLVESRKESLCNIPNMNKGSQPTDSGFFFLTPSERKDVLEKEPNLEPFIRQVLGSDEYINKRVRYCLWLVDAPPHLLKQSPFLSDRINKIREFRLKSPKEATRKDASTPWLFQENRQPINDYIIIPSVSSERRFYVPIGFLSSNIIATNLVLIIPDATLFHFGVLTSSVHMAWMRAVCGRLKSDYRYSKDIVYNNFIWPEASEEQKTAIEQTAQGILDARAQFPDSSLADLYDETTMPLELRKAHEANDKAVMAAYGFSTKASEEEIVATLMKLYNERTTMTKENEDEPRERKRSERRRGRQDKDGGNSASKTEASENAASEKSSVKVADFASIGIINHIIDHSVDPGDEEYEEELKTHLERFRRIEEENPNSRGTGLAEVLALLGDLHAKQGKFYEAEREYLEAEDAYNKLASFATFEYYAEIARIMSARADIYFEVQEWKAAENTYNDSLRLYNVLMAPTPYGYGAGYAHTLVNLSKLYKVTNRFDEAEKGYREVIELYRAFVARFPNEFDAKLATTLNSLACLLFEKRQYDESEKAFEEAISILRRLEDTDENANSLANALNGLGNVYADQNSPFLAEQKYAETVDIYRSLIAKGLDDWDYDLMLANTLRHLASQRVKLARDEEAEENYLAALAIAQEDNVGEYAFFIAETSFELAMFYAERGRFADAEAKFADALAILRRINAAQPGCCMLDLAFALVNLSGCRHRLGRHTEAKQGLQEALEIYRAFEKDCPGQFTGIIEDATRLLNEVCKQMNVE